MSAVPRDKVLSGVRVHYYDICKMELDYRIIIYTKVIINRKTNLHNIIPFLKLVNQFLVFHVSTLQ